MKTITFIYGPVGSGKTAQARQIFPNVPIGDTVEMDICNTQPKKPKDIGCTDTTKLLILKNIPDEEILEKVLAAIDPLLSDESNLLGIVFTSAHVKPFALPASIKDQAEIIHTSCENEELMIHYDEDNHKRETGMLDTLCKYLNEAIRIRKGFFPHIPFQKEELLEMVFNLKYFVKSRLINHQEVIVSGLKLNKEKLMDMVELPENFSKLEKIVSLAQTQIQNIMVSRRLAEPKDVLQLYILNGEDDFELKTRVYQKVKEDSEVYIRNAESKKAYFFAAELVALLRKHKVKPPQFEALVMAHLKVDNRGEYVVNWAGIKNREVNALGFPSFSRN